MVANNGLIFKKAPEAFPLVGEHLDVEIREFNTEIPPPDGGLTVKNLYISFDPYQRGGMRKPDDATWLPPYQLGQPIISGAVSKVLKSASSSFEPGDIVWGQFGTEEYSVVPHFLVPMVRKIENPLGLDPIMFTGPLGTSGLSAYTSFYEIGKPQKGQTIFISAASGGVGQIVGQIAKIEGLRVIGSVGSDEKLEFIKSLGFNAAFNYKKEKPIDALRRLAPEGLDIYYDNVGGETLEAAIDVMKNFGRIVACGMISQYNLPEEEKYGIKNLMNLFLKRITIQGFLISDPQFYGKYVIEFFTKMSIWLKDEKIKTKESVTVGIEHAATCFLGMYTGANFGKTVLKVADFD